MIIIITNKLAPKESPLRASLPNKQTLLKEENMKESGAPGSSLEQTSNASDGNDDEALLNSRPPSSSRPSVKARAKLDGSTKSRELLEEPRNCQIDKPLSEDAHRNDRSNGDLEECVPGRQPFLLKGPIHEESQYTTLEDAAPDYEASEPGAFPIGNSSSSVSVSAAEPNDETLVTAIKVSPGDDDADVEEAIRMAREEAEELRLQVKTLQEERQHKDAVVMATVVVDDEETNEDKDEEDGKTWTKIVTSRLLPCIVLIGCIAGGSRLGIRLSQRDSVVPVFVTVAPTPSPTLFPCVQDIYIDGVNKTNVTTLQICQGDCNKDDDCADGLICFHRSGAYAPVPGCSCWEADNTRHHDYCIEPPTEPCLVETYDFPLGLCEGNCHSDFDCQEGFVCHESYSSERSSALPEIPGCRWCPTEGLDDDLLRNGTTVINATISTSKFCVKREECFGCGLDAPPSDMGALPTTASGSAIHIRYSIMLLSALITILVCG